jgi:hypothetical protein
VKEFLEVLEPLNVLRITMMTKFTFVNPNQITFLCLAERQAVKTSISDHLKITNTPKRQ